MRQVTRWMVLFCLLAAASTLWGCISQTKTEVPAPTKNQIGANDTAFVLSDLSGKDIKFPSDFSGKRVLMVFFSTG
ncbi:MAG: hypothetical protein ABFD04_08130 [Syntrophomonas sp.]